MGRSAGIYHFVYDLLCLCSQIVQVSALLVRTIRSQTAVDDVERGGQCRALRFEATKPAEAFV